MADKCSNEGSSSSSNSSGESLDSVVDLKIKTLDSQIYGFRVDKNMLVSLFKEKIAEEVGVPVGQQRLIFQGKVLKDDQPLSEYHVDNGHTLHLVVRQPMQSQPSSGMSSGETNANNGNDANAGAPRNRVGQISHSVVLGTFNVGDQGEGIVPDVTRVIGAVLNSFGVGTQPLTNGIQTSTMSNASGQVPQGNASDGMSGSVGGQAGNQTQPGQGFPAHPFQSSAQVVQIPLTAAAAVPMPSFHSPIPDSLNTLLEFMNRMEQALAQNGYQPNASASVENLPRVELPTNARGLPTPEALSVVLRRAQRLLGGRATDALSHMAGSLEEEGASSDPAIRGRIQSESVQLGLAMQHIGALLLELGRTILMLRMGQSPAESSVNAGPATYISPSGPNPIMVQPFPLQTSSLFGGVVPPVNPTAFGPVGVGSAPRHINIHIHAVGSRGNNGDGMQGERGNDTVSGDSGPMRVLPVRNVMTAAVPSWPTGVAISSAAQPGTGFSVSQSPPDSVSLSSLIGEVNSRLRNLVGNTQGENEAASGQLQSTEQASSGGSGGGNDVSNELLNNVAVSGAEEQSNSLPRVLSENDTPKPQPECNKGGINENTGSSLSSKVVPLGSGEGSSSCSNGKSAMKSEDGSANILRSSEKHDHPEGGRSVPLGLGLGGLERKRRGKLPKSVVKSDDSGTTSAFHDQTGSSGQQLLQSLASHNSAMHRTGADDPSSSQLPPVFTRTMESRAGGQGSDDPSDAASAMSQVLQSPALDGLLAGISGQTGVGSPNVLRNMLQQLTQSPQIMNTVQQIAQQVDGQDLDNLFSGMGGGPGGGMDLSRMVQQMMPIVSRAFSGGSTASPPFPAVEPEQQQQHDGRTRGADKPDDQGFQVHVQQVTEMIEQSNPPANVFRAMVENAVQLHGSGSSNEDLVRELSSNEDLANEYMEMLRHDIARRLQNDSGEDKS